MNLFADDDSSTYEGLGTTDANGNYVTAVSTGSWYVSPDRTDPSLASFIVSEGANFTLNTGQAVREDFVALLATNQISGLVLDVSNSPVANVGVYGYATINGTTFSQYTDTAADGSWSFNVSPGAWNIGVNCSGSADSLSALKYECVNEVPITISTGNATTNFTVKACGQLVVTTPSPLPPGSISLYYEEVLQAAGCNQPFTWAIAPGSQPPPAGLSLGSDGTLSGYPTASGTSSFTVRVSDSSSNHLDQAFSLAIAATPLQVVTTNLPGTQTGASYSQQLSASGGTLPYAWAADTNSGNLPPGLTLSPSGLLSGSPTLGATFYFDVQVTDARGSNAVGSLSLVVTNNALTVTNMSLPNATVGLPYLAQLGASGGQPPYGWDLAGGSTGLPSGLTLSSTGAISGTPDTAGLFSFVVQATDANSTTGTQLLSILVNPGLAVGAPDWSPSGQFRFQVEGTTGQSYTVEFSSDLKTWTPVQTNTAPTDLFTVTVGATGDWGFYRVKGN